MAALVGALLQQGDLNDDSYRSAAEELGEALIFELNILVGYYSLLAVQLKIFT